MTSNTIFSDREIQILQMLDISIESISDREILKTEIQTKYIAYLVSQKIQSNTLVDIEVDNPESIVEHEAVTGKISEQILNYLMSRGLDEDKAVSMFVSGYFKEVFVNLPFEFAVEAKKLVEMKIEGF